jgi:hypothetical protein
MNESNKSMACVCQPLSNFTVILMVSYGINKGKQ